MIHPINIKAELNYIHCYMSNIMFNNSIKK